MGVTAQDVLNVMRSWIGFSEANGSLNRLSTFTTATSRSPVGMR